MEKQNLDIKAMNLWCEIVRYFRVTYLNKRAIHLLFIYNQKLKFADLNIYKGGSRHKN